MPSGCYPVPGSRHPARMASGCYTRLRTSHTDGMGGGGDSEPTQFIEIPDSDDPDDWRMDWEVTPLKKQKKH